TPGLRPGLVNPLAEVTLAASQARVRPAAAGSSNSSRRRASSSAKIVSANGMSSFTSTSRFSSRSSNACSCTTSALRRIQSTRPSSPSLSKSMVELRVPRTVEIAQDPAPLRRILVVVPSQEIPLILREPRHYVPHLARRDVGYVGRRSRFLRRAQDGHQQQDTERPDVHAGLRANRSLISFFTCASSSPSSWSRGGRTRALPFP